MIQIGTAGFQIQVTPFFPFKLGLRFEERFTHSGNVMHICTDSWSYFITCNVLLYPQLSKVEGTYTFW